MTEDDTIRQTLTTGDIHVTNVKYNDGPRKVTHERVAVNLSYVIGRLYSVVVPHWLVNCDTRETWLSPKNVTGCCPFVVFLGS